MILRRITDAFKRQDWFTVFVETLIVVLGVFLGLQVNNWNEAREAAVRRAQITQALVTDLRDASNVQRGFVANIDKGLGDWRASFDAGILPPPYYMRIEGSDTGPKTWDTLQQMPLSDMFDAITIFDLSFYYSEQDGIGRKYIRYVTFVENDILPNLFRDPAVFYNADHSALQPEYTASMDRLREYAAESRRLERWGNCLVYRLEAKRTFEQTCARSHYVLDGMPVAEEAPQ